jgi:ABC-2 type transport system permease protein
VWVLGVGLVVGSVIHLPPPAPGLVWQSISDLALSALLTVVIVMPIIFSACAGRGYLLPMGVMFLCIILGQVASITGWGEFFPWSIPAVFAQAAGKHNGYPGVVSYIIVLLTGVAGVAGAFLWWELADETH